MRLNINLDSPEWDDPYRWARDVLGLSEVDAEDFARASSDTIAGHIVNVYQRVLLEDSPEADALAAYMRAEFGAAAFNRADDADSATLDDA